VKAAASACYITSFRELLTAPAGPQEAEQSIPHFLGQGLDFADWVELAAPRPDAIVSTTNDMFPFEGARQTYDEAKRIYGLYGAADRLQWITGPGVHGALGPVSPAILASFVRWLKDSDARPGFTRLRPDRPGDLLCTPTGQLAASFKGEAATSLNRRRAETLLPVKRALSSGADLDRLQTLLREDIRTTALVTAQPGSAPPVVTVLETAARDNYRLETISLRSEEGIDLPGWMAIPKHSGAKLAVLMLESRDGERLAAPGGDLDRLAKFRAHCIGSAGATVARWNRIGEIPAARSL
jgi:hypothetical protein